MLLQIIRGTPTPLLYDAIHIPDQNQCRGRIQQRHHRRQLLRHDASPDAADMEQHLERGEPQEQHDL